MKLDELVNRHFTSLKQNDLHIWKYISNHKKECCNLTIDELAEKCNVSRSSILRFSQRISLKGYSELKVYLKWDEQKTAMQKDLVESYCGTISRLIENYGKLDFTEICKMIYKSKKVFLYGTGALQRTVAKEMRRIFLSAHEHFYMIDGVDELDALFNTLTSEDLVFMISLNGQSDNAKSFAQHLNLKGIPFISMTRIKDNEIAHYSSQSIFVDTPELNLGTASPYLVLDLYFILADILFLNYIQYIHSFPV